MDSKRKVKQLSPSLIYGKEKGSVLLVALALLHILSLIGTTAYIITSTDLKIGGNFRNSHMAFYAAVAGTEHGREVLRALNASSSNTGIFSDELAAKVGSNANLEGYDSDDDPLVDSTSLGDSTYVVYLTNDSVDGSTNQTDNNARVLITSVGEGPSNTFAKVEIEVIRAEPDIPSPLYAKDNFTGNGSSLTIDGNDDCATPAAALPPIYTKTPATTILNGSPTLNGNPASAVEGPIDLDIISYIQSLKGEATTILTADQNGTNFGNSTNYVTLYSDTSDPYNVQGLKIQNGVGYGLLLVEGDLTLGDGSEWHGLILVSGTLTLNEGGGDPVYIRGAVLANQTVDIDGNNDIRYDSCKVDNSLASASLTVVSWKHDY